MNQLTIAAQTIKETVSAQDVGRALGLEIRHGRCKCPIHHGDDFNCRLYAGNRGYMCWVCKSAGDVISFIRNIYHEMRFSDAISWFNDTFHLGLDIESSMSPEALAEAKKAQRERDARIAAEKWIDDMRFNMALKTFDVVRILETQRDDNTPKTPDEPWTAPFCQAVELLPMAEQMARDAWFDCIKHK